MKAVLHSVANRLLTRVDRSLYETDDFVVVSNNCWGAEIYRRLGKPYNTPFVGLAIWGPDYLRLLQDFDRYMRSELVFVDDSRYWDGKPDFPVGILGGEIEILFIHYKNRGEARNKWERRTERMLRITDKDRYFFKYCDRDDATPQMIAAFHDLPYKNKVSFGIEDLSIPNHIRMRESDEGRMVVDGKKLYRYTFRYFDPLRWVTDGRRTSNAYGRFKAWARLATQY